MNLHNTNNKFPYLKKNEPNPITKNQTKRSLTCNQFDFPTILRQALFNEFKDYSFLYDENYALNSNFTNISHRIMRKIYLKKLLSLLGKQAVQNNSIEVLGKKVK